MTRMASSLEDEEVEKTDDARVPKHILAMSIVWEGYVELCGMFVKKVKWKNDAGLEINNERNIQTTRSLRTIPKWTSSFTQH